MGLAVLGEQLDLMILNVFSNLNDFMIATIKLLRIRVLVKITLFLHLTSTALN